MTTTGPVARRLLASGGRRARPHASVAAALVVALGAGAVVLPLATGVHAPSAVAAPGDVVAAGRVFADYDGDGVYDPADADFAEHGINGVTVTVTDALGRSATTRSVRQQEFVLGTGGQPGGWAWTSEGDWSMTEGDFAAQNGGEVPFVKAGQTAAQLRVTFSDVPAGYESWFAGDLEQNGTSVQLVQAGDTGVDYAVLRPELYRQDPFDVLTAVQSAGDPDPTTPNFVDTPALVSTDWSTSQEIHSYVDANGNGVYDAGEDFAPQDPDGAEYRYFQDANGNGFWDEDEELSEVAFDDTNGNEVWDSGPWTNPTAYSTVTPDDPTTIAGAPVTVSSLRVLLPDGQECWTGPFTFDDRLVSPVTVPDDPATPVDESANPRPVAYYETIPVSCWNYPGPPLPVVFVPGGFWDGEPQYTAFPTTEQTTPEDPRTLAMFSELGSVWGTAYEKTSNTAILSAVYKRVSGLAEHQWGGDVDRALGGIFRIADVMAPGTGKVAAGVGPAGSVEPWFSLEDLGIDVGTVPDNGARGLGAATDTVADPDGFANAAKVGIGGIDTWTDGFTTYLFVMNLFDRTLYRIDISGLAEDPGFVPTAGAVSAFPLGLDADERPWAVEVWDDEVYVGWTDTGSAPGLCATITDPGDPPIGGEAPDPDLPDCAAYEPLDAHVAVLGVDAAAGTAPAETFTYSLGYPRGNPIGNWGDQGDRYSDENPQTRHWSTWTDTWTWDPADADADGWPDGSVGIDTSQGTGWSTGHQLQVYPQAVLSSLTFDDHGFMTMGLLDRTELQAGNIQWAADVGQPGGTSAELFFETVSAGEMLASGWNLNEQTYVLENRGYVRAWGADGTYYQRWDASIESHSSGPGGYEFYDDDQALDASARGAGTTLNHYETALGAVLHPPGALEAASTAFDPLVNIRVQGLMWFTTDAGTPDRAVELTDDPGQATSPTATFQKGGGLGDLDALLPPPPVEIGNRVWFDADQDGYQSADEPGIGGVSVELVDDVGTVIGTQTTASDGTYYFSTRDDDPVDHYAPMEHGEEYTVRFVRPASGTLTASLWGTTVTAPWPDVLFTDQQVEPVTTLLNPHDPVLDNADGVNERPDPLPEEPAAVVDADRIDSNPAVDTGEHTFTLGGPGQNEHSIDAGFVAYAPLDVLKIVDPAGAVPAPGATFDIRLDALDFRGLAAGPVDPDPDAAFTFADLAALPQNAPLRTAADPDGIADGVLRVQVGAGGAVPVARVWFPLGSTVEVAELAADDVEVSYDPNGPVLLDDGSTAAVTTVRVTNLLPSGTFTVVKAVTGAAAAGVPEGSTFPMEYSVDGGSTWVPFTIGYDGDGDGVPAPFVSPVLPVGTVVQVREVLPAAPPGVVWGDVTVAGSGVTYDPGTGIASFTVTDTATALTLTVTNVAEPAPGGFEVVKSITGAAAGLVDPGTAFPVEWTTTPDDDGSWQPLEVLADGTPVGVDGLPAGTVVTVREGDALPDVEGVVWGNPAFSVGGGAPQPGPVSFVVEAGTTVSITVTNLAEPAPGTFSVRKIVGGPAAGVVAQSRPTFVVEYAVDDGDPGTPLDWVPLDIPWGEVAFPAEEFPPGTVVLLRETSPLPAVDGVEWGTPSLFVDGEAAASPATLVIRPGNEPAPVITLVNTAAAEPGSFTVAKTVQGPAADDVPPGTTFTVEYTIDGAAPEQVEVPFGAPVTVPDVPAGSTVTIEEVAFPDLPDIRWGTPVITVDGVAQAGTPVTFTVEAGTGVSIGVINTANEEPGVFTVTKSVVGDAAAAVPAGTELILEYSLDAGATWAGLTVPVGALVTSGEVPAGTQVWVREGPLPTVAGVVWGEPVISGAGVTTDPETGYATFVVGAGGTVELSLENTADVAPGGFRVLKAVDGPGSSRVPSDAEFTVEYSTDGGDVWTPLTVTPSGLAVVVDGLPAGTVVLLRETGDRPDLPGVGWADVTIGGEGVDYDPGSGVASLTVGAGTTVTVTVTNTVGLLPGTFSVVKLLDGPAAAQVPDGTTFVVEYSVDGGAPQRQVLDVAEVWTSPELPAGAVVTVTEVDLPAVDGVEWGTPLLGVDGAPPVPGPVTFTVGAGTRVSVEVTNTAGTVPAVFTVAKSVVGAQAAAVREGTVFVLEYSLDGGATWRSLDVPLGEVVTSPPLAAGAEVLVREGAEPAVDGVVWGERVLTVDGVVASDGLGSFTAGPGTTVAVVMQDTADPVPPTPRPSPSPSPSPQPSAPVPPPATGPDLPQTGADGGTLTVVGAAGLLLVLLGGALVGRSRRRSRPPAR